MKFFDSRTFLIDRSVPQRNFSALWAEKCSTENSDIPFSFKIFFRYLTFETFWNIRWLLAKFFGTVRQKKRRKIVIRMKVSDIPSFPKLRSGPQDFFMYCETKLFDWRTRFSVLMHRKFRYSNCSGRLKALPTKFFQYCEAKKINGDSRYPLLRNFRCPKDSETQRGSPTNFIGSKRDVNSTEKSDITL